MSSWDDFIKSISYGIKPGDRRLLGLKIAFVGLIVALIGLGAFLLFETLTGQLVIAGGMAIGFVGVVVHFYMMVKNERSRTDTEQSGTDPKP